MSSNPTETESHTVTEPKENVDLAPTETESGLDGNVAGALSYLLGIVTGVIFYVVEKEDEFVRFHAAQSIATFGGVIVVSILLSIVGTAVSAALFTGSPGGFAAWGILSLLLGLVSLAFAAVTFGLWVYLMVRAYQGKTPRVPIAARIADRMV